MTKTDNADDRSSFDDGCRARDAGDFVDALRCFQYVVDQARSSDKLVAHAWLQIGFLAQMQGNLQLCVSANGRAVELQPHVALASLALFHALVDQGQTTEALGEAVRFLTLADSDDYVEMLSGPEYRNNLNPADRALADKARTLLVGHGRHLE